MKGTLCLTVSSLGTARPWTPAGKRTKCLLCRSLCIWQSQCCSQQCHPWKISMHPRWVQGVAASWAPPSICCSPWDHRIARVSPIPIQNPNIALCHWQQKLWRTILTTTEHHETEEHFKVCVSCHMPPITKRFAISNEKPVSLGKPCVYKSKYHPNQAGCCRQFGDQGHGTGHHW